jgi:hypothetical protein
MVTVGATSANDSSAIRAKALRTGNAVWEAICAGSASGVFVRVLQLLHVRSSEATT